MASMICPDEMLSQRGVHEVYQIHATFPSHNRLRAHLSGMQEEPAVPLRMTGTFIVTRCATLLLLVQLSIVWWVMLSLLIFGKFDSFRACMLSVRTGY